METALLQYAAASDFIATRILECNGQPTVLTFFTLAVVEAIASRDVDKAKQWAEDNGFPNAKAYGSYQELVDDSNIDAIYCPLPSGLHRQWV